MNSRYNNFNQLRRVVGATLAIAAGGSALTGCGGADSPPFTKKPVSANTPQMQAKLERIIKPQMRFAASQIVRLAREHPNYIFKTGLGKNLIELSTVTASKSIGSIDVVMATKPRNPDQPNPDQPKYVSVESGEFRGQSALSGRSTRNYSITELHAQAGRTGRFDVPLFVNKPYGWAACTDTFSSFQNGRVDIDDSFNVDTTSRYDYAGISNATPLTTAKAALDGFRAGIRDIESELPVSIPVVQSNNF